MFGSPGRGRELSDGTLETWKTLFLPLKWAWVCRPQWDYSGLPPRWASYVNPMGEGLSRFYPGYLSFSTQMFKCKNEWNPIFETGFVFYGSETMGKDVHVSWIGLFSCCQNTLPILSENTAPLRGGSILKNSPKFEFFRYSGFEGLIMVFRALRASYPISVHLYE